MRQSQIVQSVMYSSDGVLITQFLYNPYHSLLVCIDLASQLGILMRHNLAVCTFDVCIFIHSPRITYS